MSDEDWAAVVALKPAAVGKSRLAALPDPLRRRLAGQMALDCLAALASATSRLIVVSDSTTIRDRLRLAGIDAEVIDDPRPGGLNNALRAGEAALRAAGAQRVVACVGDLPALTGAAVQRVLDTMTIATSSDRRHRGFVADRNGTGSTMLLADGVPLEPWFGPGSAAAHRASGAIDLAQSPVVVSDHCAVASDHCAVASDHCAVASDHCAVASDHCAVASDHCAGDEMARARTDVDDPDDLPPAIEIGVGSHTSTLISNGRLAEYAGLTVTGTADTAAGFTAVADTGRDAGKQLSFTTAAFDGSLRSLEIGVRLHAAVADGVVISVWEDSAPAQ